MHPDKSHHAKLAMLPLQLAVVQRLVPVLVVNSPRPGIAQNLPGAIQKLKVFRRLCCILALLLPLVGVHLS